ncbi:MAG: hypothetical protein RI899_640 [Actinomycetota bacterium]
MLNLLKNDESEDCRSGHGHERPVALEHSMSIATKLSRVKVEVIKSRGDQHEGRTRFGFRRLSSSNAATHLHLGAAKVTRVESAGVIATGSRCCPRMDFLPIVSCHRQAKSSIDGAYFAPGNNVSGNWINDFQPLIKNYDFGFMHERVENTDCSSGPRATYENCSEFAGDYGFNHQADKNKTEKVKSSAAGTTSEKFNIGTGHFFAVHRRRLSQVRSVCLV